MGNLASVAKALEVSGLTPLVTSDPDQARSCDAICVPGQGIFGRCMTALAGRSFDGLIRDWIDDQKPFLGICLGLQVLFESSEEEEDLPGLGLLKGEVRRLQGDVRIPHIGWNTTSTEGGTGGERNGSYFYFDHSYAAFPDDPGIVTGWCDHGGRFAAIVETGPILAVQFHPEKSGREGIALLREWGKKL